MIHSESIAKLAEALSKPQGDMKGAKKDSLNPHFKAKYADLESSWEACREPLSKHALSVVQMPYSTDGRVGIHTILMHTSGEWIRGSIDVADVADHEPAERREHPDVPPQVLPPGCCRHRPRG